MGVPTIEKIYTDGACSGNPGPGGWGVVLYFADGRSQEIGGADSNTTNNRMELQAATAALETYGRAQQNAPIVLYTDSEYVRNGITKWISGWKKKGWKTAAGKPVMNQDLWQTLDGLNSSQVTWKYVKGHAGDPGNERADAVAVQCAQSQSSLGDTVLAPSGTPAAPTETISTPKTSMPAPATTSHLANTLDQLRMADEIATKGFLITTQELAELVSLSTSAISDRGDEWTWRNWLISRGRKEGNHILWQLERVN